MFVYQFILRLWCAQCVPVETVVIVVVLRRHGGGFRVAVIVKPAVVVFPGHAGELAPIEDLIIIFAGVQFAHVEFLPVTASFGKRISQQRAVFIKRGGTHGNSAVIAETVGVEYNLRLGVERFLHVPDILGLQSLIFQEEVTIALLVWQGIARIVPTVGQLLFERLPRRSIEEIRRQFVLRRHPVYRLIRAGVFHPAIRVGYDGAVIVVGHVTLPGWWISIVPAGALLVGV